MTINPQQISGHNRRWLRVAVPAIIIGMVACVWFGFARYHLIPKNFGVVVPGLVYRSGQISAIIIKKVLTQNNIRVIIDLGAYDPNDHDKISEKKVADELGIKVLRFPLKGDGTGDINNYAGAIAAIVESDKQGLPVLVHCSAGAQRTGGVIAAYLLLVQKKDPNFVDEELEKYGCDIDEKPALFAYFNSNMDELAMLLKKAGVIDEIPSPLPQMPQD